MQDYNDRFPVDDEQPELGYAIFLGDLILGTAFTRKVPLYRPMNHEPDYDSRGNIIGWSVVSAHTRKVYVSGSFLIQQYLGDKLPHIAADRIEALTMHILEIAKNTGQSANSLAEEMVVMILKSNTPVTKIGAIDYGEIMQLRSFPVVEPIGHNRPITRAERRQQSRKNKK